MDSEIKITMKKKILFLCLYLCVSLMSIAQNALCVYPKSGVDSLPIAFRVFARMAYYEDSLDITHRNGWLLYAAPYDDIQHIAFINHQPTYTFVYDTICSGETYTWNGNTYSRPGVYVDTLQNIYGCDSLSTLRLTMKDAQVTIHSIQVVDQCADDAKVEINFDSAGIKNLMASFANLKKDV